MKKLAIIYLFFIWFDGQAQNLVPNFSFEQYDTCPNTEDQIQYAIGWSKFSNTASTPDYYNLCAPSSGFGIPKSIFCFQPERRGCTAYAGLGTWATVANSREHIGIQLSGPLLIGQKYFLSFYTVMGENAIGSNQFGLPSNNIGLRLSTVPFNNSKPCPIDNFAHLYSSTIIVDSVNWTRISGNIVADSAYNYLIIGNFFDDTNTDTLEYNCGSCFNAASYYLVDDICLSTDSLLCNGGLTSLPCNVSINETNQSDELLIYPNPFSDFLTIFFRTNFIGEIVLYDISGRIVYNSNAKSLNKFDINLSLISKGTYYLKSNNALNKAITINKILKL